MKRIFFLLIFHSLNLSCALPIGKATLKKYVSDGAVILDAGANNGDDTVELTKIWPNSIIYAFEPAPNAFQELLKNTIHFKNIFGYPLALSDKRGKANFYLSDINHEQSSSLLKPTLHLQWFSHVQFPHQVEVNTITLDEWAEIEGIEKIDFMWLDLQGAEYKVLSTSPKILKTVKVIFTEVNFVELYDGCVIYPLFKEWLSKQGFKEVFMYPDHTTFGDALFIRES